jgi:hypothetical protein
MTTGPGRPPKMREPGKYADISNEVYHADPYYFSSSQLKEALNSPAHFKHYVVDKGGKNKATRAMDKGTLTHTVVLEPWRVDEEYIVYQGDLTATGLVPAGAVKSHAKEFPNHTLISPEDYEFAKKARQGFEEYPEAAELIFGEGCEYESSWYHDCKETGLRLRVRPDCININKGVIVDLKTTRAKSKHEFQRDALYTFSYDLSAYMYLKLIYDMTGVKCDYYWFTVGTESMCPVAVYKLSLDTIESGKKKFYKAIDNIKTALTTPEQCRYQSGIEEI